MAKKKSKAATKQNSAASKAKEEQERVTMKALEEMSDSDDDEEIPESQWTTKAKNLRQEIDGGKFDKLLGVLKQAKGDEEEFEEASLGSSDDDEEEGDEEAEVEGDAVEDEASEEEEEDDDEDEEAESEEKEPINVEAAEAEGSDEDEEDSEDEEDTKLQRVTKNNFINSKALSIVTAELAASHAHLPWAETFCVIPATPLPFGQKGGDEDSNPLDIHDDLKREVAFYNSAIEAVHDARVKCKEANIPFSRPEDFFAEMIKTDDHMAKVKDRLIFETKKMDAVAMRKSNREQKLRAKESQSNKLAEKAKRKRDHFQEVEDWAQSAAQNRGGALRDDADEQFLRGKGSNKKREVADRKYGFGGKTGRFKQNDRATLNDTSGFNPRGNFSGMGTKKSAKSSGGAGADRQGKRARDAKRSRR